MKGIQINYFDVSFPSSKDLGTTILVMWGMRFSTCFGMNNVWTSEMRLLTSAELHAANRVA